MGRHTHEEQYFFNPTTGEVTRGKVHGWDNRMGPYKSAQEAAQALARVQERNRAADAEERAEDSWGTPPAWD